MYDTKKHTEKRPNLAKILVKRDSSYIFRDNKMNARACEFRGC